jgi:hypothetical protein
VRGYSILNGKSCESTYIRKLLFHVGDELLLKVRVLSVIFSTLILTKALGSFLDFVTDNPFASITWIHFNQAVTTREDDIWRCLLSITNGFFL